MEKKFTAGWSHTIYMAWDVPELKAVGSYSCGHKYVCAWLVLVFPRSLLMASTCSGHKKTAAARSFLLNTTIPFQEIILFSVLVLDNATMCG